MRTGGWRYWLTGLVIGAAVGTLYLIFPTLGLIGIGVFFVLALAGRSVPLVSGGLVGFGGVWLAFLVRAVLSCQAIDAEPNQGCVVPSDISLFIGIGLGIVVVGIVVGLVGWWVSKGTNTPG